jgi:hypothetical protein
MLICGPFSAEQQVKLPNGAASAIDGSGALIDAALDKDSARESEWVDRR